MGEDYCHIHRQKSSDSAGRCSRTALKIAEGNTRRETNPGNGESAAAVCGLTELIITV